VDKHERAGNEHGWIANCRCRETRCQGVTDSVSSVPSVAGPFQPNVQADRPGVNLRSISFPNSAASVKGLVRPRRRDRTRLFVVSGGGVGDPLDGTKMDLPSAMAKGRS